MPRPIKVDDLVKSADGGLYIVRYVHTARQVADLSPFDMVTGTDFSASNLELPVGELRRIPDPRNSKPPIDDMPAERPTCQYCGKGFKPVTRNTYRDLNGNRGLPYITKRTFSRWDAYYDLFCTHRCAGLFATASHRAGYRITRKPGTK